MSSFIVFETFKISSTFDNGFRIFNYNESSKESFRAKLSSYKSMFNEKFQSYLNLG